MKPNLLILTLLATSLAFYATGKDLQKEEAKKQIEQTNYDLLYSSFYLNKVIDGNNVPDNIKALKKAGFIDLVSSGKDSPGNLEITILKKGQPFVIKEENNELHFRVGATPIEIMSISTPEVNGKAGDVCNVVYKQTVKHNAFFKAWNPHCLKEGTFKYRVTFINSKNGWQMVKDVILDEV